MVTSISEKDSGLLGCDTLSLGEWFLALRMIVVPLLPVAKLSARFWTESTVIVRGIWNHSSVDSALCPR